MNKETLLAGAIEKRDKAIGACNKIAEQLVAQLHPFMSGNAETVLSAEDDEVMSLAMDLVDARSRLKSANDVCESLKRRAQ